MLLHSELKTILVFLVAFFTTLFLLPSLMRVALRIGLMDLPTQRKVHVTPRPLVGGIGIVLGVMAAALLFIPATGLRGLFAGIALLLLVGILDDLKEISHHPKLLAQILATVLLIYFSQTVLYSFGDLLGLGSIDIKSDWLAYGITVFCVVGLINSLNMIDGLDGLAGGVAFIAFLTFAAHASLAGQTVPLLLCVAFAGALLGFLRFNWHPAVLFMGDAGSLCLGFALCYLAITLTQTEGSTVRPVSALLILGVPITDTLILMVKRLSKGKNPMKADRYHLHHLLMRYGLNRKLTAKVIIGLTAIMGGCSLLGATYLWSDRVLFMIFAIYFVFVFSTSFFIVEIFRYRLKFKRRREWRKSILTLVVKKTIVFLDCLRIFRKSRRYSVALPMICHTGGGALFYKGTVLNISSNGLMAHIPQMHYLQDTVEIELGLPAGFGDQSLLVPAVNLWLARKEDGYYHGFCFNELNSQQEEIIADLIGRAGG
jgi:UDP-GlcNAc:undecaprenyl-phosphate GlcNAc-1-phosphate transferase